MLSLFLRTTLLFSTVFAAPAARTKSGLIIGSTSGNVDTFLGIPYADPPVGSLRLRRPQHLSKPLGTFNATNPPKACPQKPATGENPIIDSFPPEVKQIYTTYNTPYPSTGEDCLTINVQRPANTTADAKLPVLFWIYGGAWEDGATVAYDWRAVVAKSVSLGESIMVVEANYRLNTFGFLGGREVKAEGIANLGLRDQRLALEWVQENIGAFGGDPTKVTIFGQSAGSVSVYHHLLINNGNHTSTSTGNPLFRSAIMHSGAAFAAEPIDSDKAQATYDFIVSEVGCSTAKSSLECLRNAPYEKLAEATNNITLLYSSNGFFLNFVPRPDNSDSFFTTSEYTPGDGIADVPLIVGHQEDEATTFLAVTPNVTTNAALVSMLQHSLPHAPQTSLEQFVAYYKGDKRTGAPFRTNASQNAYPHSKINSAVVTDVLFLFPIRRFLHSITGSSSVYKHKDSVWVFQGSYMHGFPLLGTFHGSDTVLFAIGQPVSVYDEVVSRYVRFLRTGVPESDSSGAWPAYSARKELLQFNVGSDKLIKDDFRMASYQYWEHVKGMWKY